MNVLPLLLQYHLNLPVQPVEKGLAPLAVPEQLLKAGIVRHSSITSFSLSLSLARSGGQYAVENCFCNHEER